MFMAAPTSNNNRQQKLSVYHEVDYYLCSLKLRFNFNAQCHKTQSTFHYTVITKSKTTLLLLNKTIDVPSIVRFLLIIMTICGNIKFLLIPRKRPLD